MHTKVRTVKGSPSDQQPKVLPLLRTLTGETGLSGIFQEVVMVIISFLCEFPCTIKMNKHTCVHTGSYYDLIRAFPLGDPNKK